MLELACGTGLITVPVALQRLPTVGLDQSGAMLKFAKQRASAANVSIEFIQGDMRDFALDRNFDFIFVARNSLLHLLSTDDLLAALISVRRHLTPGGLFAFDVFNPSVRLLAQTHAERVQVMEVDTSELGQLRVDETRDYDSAAQVTHATWYVSAPDRPDAWVVPLVLRNIFPQELPLLLSAAGLELIERFGDLSREPFGRDSRLQVCLCRRRRDS